MSMSEMEGKMQTEEVIEMENIRELVIHLDEERALNLLGLMDKYGISDPEEVIRETIKRQHLQEENSRSWKSRVKDRRRLLKKRLDRINDKIKMIQNKKKWKKLLLRGRMNKLKRKKKRLEAKLKEQTHTFRLVDKSE